MNKIFPKWCGVYHSQLLLHFGKNFIRIWTKKCKVTDAWKFAYFMKCNQSSKYVTAVLLIFYIWLLIHLKWHSRSFRLHQIFPIQYRFDGPNAFFFPNSTGPWPWLEKCRKIPVHSVCFHDKNVVPSALEYVQQTYKADNIFMTKKMTG